LVNEQMSVGNFLNFSIENAKKSWLKFLGLMIIAALAFVLCGALSMALMALGSGDEVIGFILGAFGTIASIAVMTTIAFGFQKNILNVCRGRPVDLGEFFRVKPMVIVNFIVGTAIVGVAVMVGLILFVVPGIILAYMMLLTPYLIIDREMGPIEAIKESCRLTKGHKMDMFFGIFVGGLVANALSVLIITVVFTVPMMCFLWVYPYLQLTGQLDAAQGQPGAQAGAAAQIEKEGGQA